MECRCGKMGYISLGEARKAIQDAQKHGNMTRRLRVYRCPTSTLYHLSSSHRRKR